MHWHAIRRSICSHEDKTLESYDGRARDHVDTNAFEETPHLSTSRASSQSNTAQGLIGLAKNETTNMHRHAIMQAVASHEDKNSPGYDGAWQDHDETGPNKERLRDLTTRAP